MKYICIWLLILTGAAALRPIHSAAFDYRLEGGLYTGLFASENFWNPYTRRFDRDETYAVTSAHADMALEFSNRFSCFLAGAVDWIHDMEPESRDDVDTELLQAFGHFTGERFSADVGKQSFVFGRGLIFDDDVTGVYVSRTIGNSYYLELKAAHAFGSSPLVCLTAGYRPGFLESVELFGIYMKDDENGFADLLNRQVGLDLFTGDGDLFWTGIAAELFVGDVYLSGIGMVQTGRMHITSPEGTRSFDISAYLVDVAAGYNLTDVISVEAFLFGASGDRHPGDDDFQAFVSPLPYNTRAAIFFNGGIDGNDAVKGFSLAGTRLAGVMAPGLGITVQPDSNWLIEWSTAAFFPQEHADDGSCYGWETDLSITRSWGANHSAYLLLGYFNPDDLPASELPDSVMSATIGVSMWF